MPKIYDTSMQKQALQMRRSGCTYQEIYAALRVTAPTVSRWEDENLDFAWADDGCATCGLRGEHECLPPVWHYGARRIDRGVP